MNASTFSERKSIFGCVFSADLFLCISFLTPWSKEHFPIYPITTHRKSWTAQHFFFLLGMKRNSVIFLPALVFFRCIFFPYLMRTCLPNFSWLLVMWATVSVLKIKSEQEGDPYTNPLFYLYYLFSLALRRKDNVLLFFCKIKTRGRSNLLTLCFTFIICVFLYTQRESVFFLYYFLL